MTHKLIHTPDYLLIVDDSDICTGDTVLVNCTELEVLDVRQVTNYYNEQFLFDRSSQIHMDYCRKIIAHLPLNNSSILEGVDLLPPLEDEVEELAEREYSEQSQSCDDDPNEFFNYPGYLKAGFINGYNKAKEKHKYTEEDISIMVNNAVVFAESNTHLSVGEYARQFKDFYDKCIQSLNLPKMPVVFDCRVGVCENWLNEECDNSCCGVPEKRITSTTPKGHTQWVGKYIY